MRGKCPEMQQKRQWSLTAYASSKSCLQYLTRQGQAMQGDTDDESNVGLALELLASQVSMVCGANWPRYLYLYT